MTSDDKLKPRPIQVRLPEDVEESLRYVASKTRSTLNGVVIECLREHLPAVTPIDFALYDGVSFTQKDERERVAEVHERLGRYRKAIHLQLESALNLASLLNVQARETSDMQDSILNGLKPLVPSVDHEIGGSPDSGASLNRLDFLHASRLLDIQAALARCRKAMARAHYDAASEWEYVKILLDRLHREAT